MSGHSNSPLHTIRGVWYCIVLMVQIVLVPLLLKALDSCIHGYHFSLYIHVHLLEVPKQQTCMKCLYSASNQFVLLHTVHTCLLLRKFQQNSCSAQPGQHSHMQASCCPGQHLHMQASCCPGQHLHMQASCCPGCALQLLCIRTCMSVSLFVAGYHCLHS